MKSVSLVLTKHPIGLYLLFYLMLSSPAFSEEANKKIKELLTDCEYAVYVDKFNPRETRIDSYVFLKGNPKKWKETVEQLANVPVIVLDSWNDKNLADELYSKFIYIQYPADKNEKFQEKFSGGVLWFRNGTISMLEGDKIVSYPVSVTDLIKWCVTSGYIKPPNEINPRDNQ